MGTDLETDPESHGEHFGLILSNELPSGREVHGRKDKGDTEEPAQVSMSPLHKEDELELFE